MKMKLQLIAIGILLSINVFADGYYPEPTSQDQPWTIIASFGSGGYQHMYSKDGKTALGRLALANELMLSGDIALGLELGVQNGNKMRLNIPRETLSVLGWLPVETNLSPMLDLLVTAKSDPLFGSSFFAQLKGGVAYRSWQFDLYPINEISQLAGEIQAGFGYPITALASLSLLYQGVFGNDPNVKLNVSSKTGSVSNIPVLHGILLGFTVNL
ncbi:TPA: hypothetical protein JBE16_05525 [Legionella pneumophila subsp. pneumophila]|uniref:hypothetical protein n=1 Tax=Legionella sp. PATHC039 TaxID=2992042 RepID=UPI001A22930D|nr:hypothetical protein [Legionella sp. PATHC039]MCW8395487.1 hypothetical protein [Legionella sp. PATHC039]HAT8858882.1 hypothetical protein [Legionella pneumophila subsp. pneumophila]HAT9652291.1 hypothetical protein [Legionella pneumophila subsp. pneumophila]HAT9919682.1 hypothetical protein [Legionella pneumophila subsp. pneumophila]